MRRPVVLLFAFSLLLFTVPADPRAQDPAANYSVAVNLVKVPFTVFDADGRFVSDLRREDFQLYEDGVLQDIRSFGIDRNPVSIVLLIDTSATVEKELKKIKSAAEGFTAAMSDDDRVAVITFGDEVKLVQDWTDDERRVRRTIRRLEPGLRTALYDAMFTAGQEQFRGIDGRKAIILLTDCLNNQSAVNFSDAVQSIVQSQASLYVVSKTVMVRRDAYKQRRVIMLSNIYRRMFGDADYVDEFFSKREAEMISLAEKTGGRCFFPADYDRMRDNYVEVAEELKNQHYLTYVSNLRKSPNSYHEIVLDYVGPGARVNYRRGYFFEPKPVHKRR